MARQEHSDPFADADGRILTCVSEALERRSTPRVDELSNQYTALLGLMKLLDFDNEDHLLAAALSVYGWMPTMMDRLTHRDALKRLIADLRCARREQTPEVLR